MTDSTPQKPINTTNELAKERNRAAAERTINAWLGICLSLIGFGVAFDQIFLSLRQRFPETSSTITREAATLIGMGFVEIGLVLLGVGLVQHRLAIKSIEHPNYVMLSTRKLNRIVVIGIVILGIAGFFATLFLI
ncbi:DUF202 domain-containing protein [Phormidium sp. FACHB-1136]|jgi:putative membrane protein|uniref:YidH family protein n=1 Tax=Phormidium sp. FACHB-1136 TaxID=2692848 RepID=UPI001689BA86|nr:DUF202 domain-containing protein [Phormidium sp. FACHB-1136]MBD2424918.1 DUF202 domain-containing protein [Phormidium sp. FACHB-1136]